MIEETAFASSTSECVIQPYTYPVFNSDSQESPVGIITVFLKTYHWSRSQEATGNRVQGKIPSFIAKGEMLMRTQCSMRCSDEEGDGQSSLSTWFLTRFFLINLKSTKTFRVFDDMRAFPGRLNEDRSPILNVNATIPWFGVSPTYKKGDWWAQNFVSFYFLPPDQMWPMVTLLLPPWTHFP